MKAIKYSDYVKLYFELIAELAKFLPAPRRSFWKLTLHNKKELRRAELQSMLDVLDLCEAGAAALKAKS